MSLNVLVLCERSGAIREAFASRGHFAMSVDTLPTTTPTGPHASGGSSSHVVGDALDFLPDEKNGTGWDLVIARPPCTYLTNSGVRWLFEGTKVVDGEIVSGELTDRARARWDRLAEAVKFFNAMKRIDSAFIAIENPIPHKYAREGINTDPEYVGIGAPDQIVQPWMFGHPESKGTGWWLKGLPLLQPTKDVKAEMKALPAAERNRVHYASPGPDRWMKRSLLVQGMADAIADQWGSFVESQIDRESSASRQGFIESGRYNTYAETAEFSIQPDVVEWAEARIVTP